MKPSKPEDTLRTGGAITLYKELQELCLAFAKETDGNALNDMMRAVDYLRNSIIATIHEAGCEPVQIDDVWFIQQKG